MRPEEDFFAFRGGKQACPRRFFAANEIKMLMAYIICNYEFRLKGDRPKNSYFDTTCLPDLKAKMERWDRKKSNTLKMRKPNQEA
jgi:hypothetical protein